MFTLIINNLQIAISLRVHPKNIFIKRWNDLANITRLIQYYLNPFKMIKKRSTYRVSRNYCIINHLNMITITKCTHYVCIE